MDVYLHWMSAIMTLFTLNLKICHFKFRCDEGWTRLTFWRNPSPQTAASCFWGGLVQTMISETQHLGRDLRPEHKRGGSLCVHRRLISTWWHSLMMGWRLRSCVVFQGVELEHVVSHGRFCSVGPTRHLMCSGNHHAQRNYFLLLCSAGRPWRQKAVLLMMSLLMAHWELSLWFLVFFLYLKASFMLI